MFETFSAKAIEALNLAREEARRLEFVQVDTDHLLLGLIAEDTGIAAQALRASGLDHRKLRLATERLWGRGYSRSTSLYFSPDCLAVFAAAASGGVVDTLDLLLALLDQPERRGSLLLGHVGVAPAEVRRTGLALRSQDLATPGAIPQAGRPHAPEQFSPRLLTESARHVYELAYQMAQAYGHTLVGTEQLLIALLAVEEGTASRILKEHGLNRTEAEAVALRLIGRGSGTALSKHALSTRTKAALEAAWREAKSRRHEQIGTSHLLLGVIGLDAGGALTLLDLLKINLASLQIDIEQALEDLRDRLHPPPTS